MGLFSFFNKNAKKIKEHCEIKGDCMIVNKMNTYIPSIGKLLNPAAEDIKIDELESISGEKIPEDFRKLYLAYNGEGEKIFGVMSGFRWMNIDSVIREWSSLQESAYDIISDKDGLIKEGKFKKGWIPFAEDCGGSFLVMDLEPGVRGTYGQIITIDRNSDISYVVSKSLAMFFEFIENSFKNGNLNAFQDENVKVIQWKKGHLFDDITALTGKTTGKETLPISRFWAEYFKNEVVNESISADILAEKTMVFIKADMAKKFGAISLDILKNMINLRELIIHAGEVISFDPLKDISSLKKLVIGSKSFKDSDLEYITNLQGLKELTLVKLTLNDIHILQKIKTLKTLRLNKLTTPNISAIGYLKGLTELSLEDMEVGDLLYLSALNKLTKLELKKVNIPNLGFLQDLKKLTVFETDRKAEDESNIGIFEEMQKLKELIYPIGDMKIIKNSINLRTIGVDASKLEALEYISGLNITSITIFNAASEEDAKSTVSEFKKYFKLQSYGWQQTWKS